MSSELEIKSQLLDYYQRFKRIRKAAEKDGATETVEMIDEELEYIRLKLQPMELPD
ncbi:MAG: hypothetical protein NC253_06030 [Ruminococcus sp.]|nr:hypothetical protein [Ruminococcus sp.]MCM1382579.1 hypothetical protein [Muribaculaceae bacterium]MCM1480626.1 hypothetical protein [Muribaculaceae bacterium]